MTTQGHQLDFNVDYFLQKRLLFNYRLVQTILDPDSKPPKACSIPRGGKYWNLANMIRLKCIYDPFKLRGAQYPLLTKHVPQWAISQLKTSKKREHTGNCTMFQHNAASAISLSWLNAIRWSEGLKWLSSWLVDRTRASSMTQPSVLLTCCPHSGSRGNAKGIKTHG